MFGGYSNQSANHKDEDGNTGGIFKIFLVSWDKHLHHLLSLSLSLIHSLSLSVFLPDACVCDGPDQQSDTLLLWQRCTSTDVPLVHHQERHPGRPVKTPGGSNPTHLLTCVLSCAVVQCETGQ